ncbi:hypothetical protein SAMN06265365_12150 [Tistlia consotensis]|uniref:Fe2OG dioxygenase domain-containing protein n=1 Tax=Tistlia consotensis USBA 355 TaxID=560819 RepID=A0A1Y6CL41_9PROT|nr:hypothetical protein [Tistlia consotensis]SMF60657.1 hypothetical protein SAMN05428998_12373 [Tistlia consotensis USBA 355]SNR93043.1 hypothetical protein SAMN06265365_12150 [Tistlia consotensis]
MKTLDLPERPEPRPDCGLLACALDELARPGRGAVSLPWLAPGRLERLRRAAARLPFRRARARVGEAERTVFQDFEITLDVPQDGLLRRFADELEADLAAALGRLERPPLAPPTLNDIAVQRYPAGSRGISPHRDHLRYRSLVVLLTLSGRARLFVCDDRAGSGAEEVSIAPGRLLLMRAPGFAGSDERPFHFLDGVSAPRYGIGLRHDRTKAP